MILTLGVLGLLWRSLSIVLLFLVLTELTWAQKHDGETLRRLRGVFASVIFVFMFPLTAAIDHHTDISPGWEWRPILQDWVWVAYATLATSTWRFLLALHAWSRAQKKAKDEAPPTT